MFKIFFSGLILFHGSAAHFVPDAGHKASIDFKAHPGDCRSFTLVQSSCVLAIQLG